MDGTNPGWEKTMPSLISSLLTAGQPIAAASWCARVVLPEPAGPVTRISVGRPTPRTYGPPGGVTHPAWVPGVRGRPSSASAVSTEPDHVVETLPVTVVGRGHREGDRLGSLEVQPVRSSAARTSVVVGSSVSAPWCDAGKRSWPSTSRVPPGRTASAACRSTRSRVEGHGGLQVAGHHEVPGPAGKSASRSRRMPGDPVGHARGLRAASAPTASAAAEMSTAVTVQPSSANQTASPPEPLPRSSTGAGDERPSGQLVDQQARWADHSRAGARRRRTPPRRPPGRWVGPDRRGRVADRGGAQAWHSSCGLSSILRPPAERAASLVAGSANRPSPANPPGATRRRYQAVTWCARIG